MVLFLRKNFFMKYELLYLIFFQFILKLYRLQLLICFKLLSPISVSTKQHLEILWLRHIHLKGWVQTFIIPSYESCQPSQPHQSRWTRWLIQIQTLKLLSLLLDCKVKADIRPHQNLFINSEGKQEVLDRKLPKDLFKRQVQFHAQAMKKVPSLKFPYFLHLPTHHQ